MAEIFDGSNPFVVPRAIVNRGGVRVATLAGNETWTAKQSTKQILDADGSTRTITLPAFQDGLGFWVRNSGATGNIVLSDGSTVATIEPGEWAVVASEGTDWVRALDSSGTSAFDVLQRLADTATGEGAALVGIEDVATIYTATTVEGALAEVKGVADTALQADDARFVTATIAVADAPGGATDAALTLSLVDSAGADITSARQVLITTTDTQYAPHDFGTPSATTTFATATTGSIIASGASWALIETDAAGDFACTVTNSADETVYFRAEPPVAVSDTAKGVHGVISNSDSAVWSA